MRLRARLLGLEAGGKPIVVLNKEDAEELGVLALDRIKLRFGGETATCIVNTTSTFVGEGEIGLYEELRERLTIEEGKLVDVEPTSPPRSLEYIKKKLGRRKLSYEELREIVKDAVEGALSEVEIAGFVMGLHVYGLDLDEAAGLSMAMVETGDTLDLDRYPVLDKHSIGGCVGDKTSLLVVPIIASLGYAIPKTSSRAITSAGGTADKAECLMPVDLEIGEMRRVVERANGCLVWGGALHLAPADDIFIQIEYPFAIDPLLLPSIMSKKKAVNATHLVIDIPTGRGTKVKTIGEAELLARDFIELGSKLGISTQVAITYGEEPISHTIGPALEAREALEILMRKGRVTDAVEKAVEVAGILLEIVGERGGKELALSALRGGRAEEKLREIIEAQGGDPGIRPDDIGVGRYELDVRAERSGYVLWMNNFSLVQAARLAGAPKDKEAGIYLHRKIGDRVEKGESILTVYSNREYRLDKIDELLEETKAIGVGKRYEMLIAKVKEVEERKRAFLLER